MSIPEDKMDAFNKWTREQDKKDLADLAREHAKLGSKSSYIPEELRGNPTTGGGLSVLGDWVLTDKGQAEVDRIRQMEDPQTFFQNLSNEGNPAKISFFYFLMSLEIDGMTTSRMVYLLNDLGIPEQDISAGFLSLYRFGYIAKVGD